MKKLYHVFIILTLCVGTAFAQSPKSSDMISGAIHNDTIWATDTIFITGDIIIPDSVCLTINSGTVVLFEDYYYFDVKGRILAQGTVAEPILFSAADTTGFYNDTHTGWSKFSFNYNTPNPDIDSSLFDYCVFEYAKSDDEATFEIINFSKIRVENSKFSNNTSNYRAACFNIIGISNIIIRKNLFTYNYGERSCIDVSCDGNEISKPIIESNIFRYNSTGTGYRSTSCLKLSSRTQARIIHNIFEFNEGHYGTIMISGHAQPLLFGNLIANNTGENGGAIKLKYDSNPSFINNTIINNHSNTEGGAFHIGCGSVNLLFQNNIIWGNTANDTASQFYCNDAGTSGYKFINNIIQFGFDSIYFESPTFDGIYQDNLDVYPEFADTANRDYHLTCVSPALDAGLNPTISLIPMFDMDGNLRISGSQIDLGMYEMPAVNLTSHPQLQAVNTGDQAEFTVIADGVSMYQWEYSSDYGNIWNDVIDNAVFSGANTNTLTINTGNSLNGHFYRCALTGTCTNQFVFSDYAILFVYDFTGIEDINVNFSVYPNPFKSGVYIENAINAEVFISDINGKVIQHVDKLNSTKELINLDNQSSGIYFLKIITNDNVQTLKLIKE